MIKAIIGKFDGLSIRYKLSVLFLVLITIPMSLVLLINMLITSRDDERQAIRTIRQMLSQTRSILEYKTESAVNSIHTIAYNETVLDLLQQDSLIYEDDISRWIADSQKLDQVMLLAKNNPDVNGIHLYMDGGLAVNAENQVLIPLSTVRGDEWFKRLSFEKGLLHWFGSEYFHDEKKAPHIHLVRQIPAVDNIHEYIGIVRLALPEQIFRTILDQAAFTPSTSVILFDGREEIICTSNAGKFGTAESIRRVLASFSQVDIENEAIKAVSYDGAQYLTGVQNIESSEWRLLLLAPYRDAINLSRKSRNQLLLIFFIIAPLTIPIAFLAASSATQRIKDLATKMHTVMDGNGEASIEPSRILSRNDEIGELMKDFDYMLSRISMLMDERFLLGKEMKNLELKALQAQINPHFLYNTLDLINWISVRKHVPEISSIVEALSKFYRLTLGSGEAIATIGSEIEHIQAYILIQNTRFNNRIDFHLDVPGSLYAFMIPKTTLQPIVENAIQHGLLEKEEEAGTIRIEGKLDDGIITLALLDDGVGMAIEKVAGLLMGEHAAPRPHGYGLRNIHERIGLNFGASYGLSFQSEPGRGTTVFIRIPAVTEASSGSSG